MFENVTQVLLRFDVILNEDFERINEFVKLVVSDLSQQVSELKKSGSLDKQFSGLRETYLRLCRLRVFVGLNCDGLRKITKKCDKVVSSMLGPAEFNLYVKRMEPMVSKMSQEANFNGSIVKTKIMALIETVECACPPGQLARLHVLSVRFAHGALGDIDELESTDISTFTSTASALSLEVTCIYFMRY